MSLKINEVKQSLDSLSTETGFIQFQKNLSQELDYSEKIFKQYRAQINAATDKSVRKQPFGEEQLKG